MYEARQNKEKVSRRIETVGGARQRMNFIDYMIGKSIPQITQMRLIEGFIKVKNQNGKKAIDQGGSSNPQGTPISNLKCGPNSDWPLMHGDCKRFTDIKGHLIKAFWDGGNEENRITQWHQDHENSWTDIENDAEAYVMGFNINGQKFFQVETFTDDPNVGDRLLGPTYYGIKDKKLKGKISESQYEIAKRVLNRQISRATMYIERHPIGTISCPDICDNLRLHD